MEITIYGDSKIMKITSLSEQLAMRETGIKRKGSRNTSDKNFTGMVYDFLKCLKC